MILNGEISEEEILSLEFGEEMEMIER